MHERTSPSIGFILLTHTKPLQIYRLINKLNTMFNYPVIVCHHDFSKCDLSVDTLSKNVLLVRPHIQTEWAGFTLVEATVQALRLMYEVSDTPDWFVLLSGADYPIKTARHILDDLASSPYDAYIEYEQITYETYKRDLIPNMLWLKNSYQRYCTKTFYFHYSKKYFAQLNMEIHLEHPLLTKAFLPFSKKLACFSGSQWFCANRKAAKYIIDFHEQRNVLTLYYSKLKYTDEAYFQTILANTPHLRLKNDCRRYIDWSTGGPHPKILLMEDLPNLLASSAHFGRKFDIDIDNNILDELDKITS
ncbi:beta-1,6-N-acetylglucosaminyltransferase [Nostoc sp. 'Lobaria pulmonaria (5183) cyanobiont']|uniref:beta-1,6-N-acetylglucosaminyltransferase n=1 Tax=Nostoc sp. 'Lobaria pulmonaria (5183) cyanobiont' TaxID=1618022 RepID=UPI000CF32BFA|nr:beta-1,6-N-acetylglucosaminyltransferase [Nostoc sp. 'Lobaria pulmonaria (5183) cyanobiont']AVH71446.1 family 14 glycosyltransferase/N-acetylglucosaminyltransferase [Nostoc sp. 'Lobaria pulmonaria (5183) cyanobiont']